VATGAVALACVCTVLAGLIAATAASGQTSPDRAPGSGNNAFTGGSLAPTQVSPPGQSPMLGQRQTMVGAGPGLMDETTEGAETRARPAGRFSISGPIDPHTYIVGPGDVLQLVMWGKISRTMEMQVSPEGLLLLPGVGTLPIAGRTLADVETDVVRVVRSQFRGVSMELQLLQPRTFRIYLTGRVRNPGPLDVTGNSRMADVLTPDLLLDGSSRRRIEILRRDGQREIGDLDRFLRVGDRRRNPILLDGDVLNVPVATDFVYAAGAVANPGRVELAAGDSLLTLFRLAGDPLPAADAERVLLVRFTKPFQPESLWFGLADAYSGRVNPPLRDGDRLYVYYIPQYHLQHEVVVLGEVARPGVYPIVEGKNHLSDLIAASGGFLPGADLSSIRVNRRNPAGSEKDPELDRLLRLSRNELTNTEFEVLRTKLANLKEDFRVDWNRLAADKTNLDLLVRDGDVIRVERLVPSIRIDGEVKRPGILVYERGLDLEEYVKQAGGYTDRAWKKRVRVTRAVTGQTTLAKNIESLDPGDLIYVPEKKDSNWGQSASIFLLFAAQIATIVLAVTAIRQQ
jgi:protein involved in polysaccharide export with SLBB domain